MLGDCRTPAYVGKTHCVCSVDFFFFLEGSREAYTALFDAGLWSKAEVTASHAKVASKYTNGEKGGPYDSH